MLKILGKHTLMEKEKNNPNSRSILELSSYDARKFFLKQESYCTIPLPQYFCFNNLLKCVANVIPEKSLLRKSSDIEKPQDHEGVNYRILTNKDGRYAWRPLEILHPALYISLVNQMTEQGKWDHIRRRFDEFKTKSPKIECLSIPVESLTNEKDKAEQVSQWWRDLEQKSIELSLDYEFLVRTDIEDCYSAIYTHSIPWALHTKEKAKRCRNNNDLIGNVIDKHIRYMRQGQTNGIPQGSVLMDFIAEMVLGYADTELMKKINNMEGYQILRYRDDYRIFVNNPQDGERILKHLTETMINLGLKLSPPKTEISNEVIRSSIKTDKLVWMSRKQKNRMLQKQLLIIHEHNMEYPNSGSVEHAMQELYRRGLNKNRILGKKKRDSPMPLISIVADIAYRSPRTYPISAAILSKLISFLEDEGVKKEIFGRIINKFSLIPNTGHMEIWLQRIGLKFAYDVNFSESLCRLICQQNEDVQIWNNEWIGPSDLRQAIDAHKIIDREILHDTPPVIFIEEVELFSSTYY